MLPYRDTNNSSVKYAQPTQSVIPTTSPNYESDFEPLIDEPPANFESGITQDDLMHFTATGRPAPKFKASALMSLGAGDSYTMPQLLPKRYTDDSIIPAIVVNILRSPKPVVSTEVQEGGKRKSFLGRLKGDKKKEEEGVIKMKVVYMPRRDYLKWFARDLKGTYIGTEPQRQWNEDELEKEFGQYQPKDEKGQKKGYRVPT
jgi:hypothetical protein